ncbi:MAG: hypothetical protein IKT98_00130 [Selenomonadaceae bacterium]|nr:hypothetical protein [Selenomonadaceae bacterium]
MKLKKFFATFTALAISATSFLPSTVHAENPKAQELRELINSNNYYVEYEVNNKEDKRALAVVGDKRKSFDCEGRRSATLLRFIPIVGLFAKGSLKLMPEVLYDSENYYQFINKKKTLKATPEELQDPYLDPSQEWSTVPIRIVLPEEFGMFTGDEEIKFVESGTFTDDKGKTQDFDKYLKVIKSVTGANLAKKVYFVFYDEKGEPARISTLTVDWEEDAGEIFMEEFRKKPEEQVYDIQNIKINKFTSEFSADVMNFKQGTKVYAPDVGNMDELLNMAPLLEEY